MSAQLVVECGAAAGVSAGIAFGMIWLAWHGTVALGEGAVDAILWLRKRRGGK